MIFVSSEVSLEFEISHPQKGIQNYLVLAHPHPKMGGTMHNKVIDQIFRRGRERGVGLLRFNFRGVQKSTGVFDRGIGEQEDLRAAYRHAVEQFSVSASSVSLLGYSFGSWISLKMADELGVKRLFLVAPPVSVISMIKEMKQVSRPTSVFVGEFDEYSNFEELQDVSRENPWIQEVVFIKDADHFFIGKTKILTESVLTRLAANL